MRNFNYMLLCGALASSLLAPGCSNDDAFKTPDTSGAPPTGIADQNSFSLARDLVAVEGQSFDGLISNVTARVADRHNHPVPDGTIVHFLTNGGAITPQCETTDGVCSVPWNSQNPRPATGIARIIAYSDGEESFIDLNDNDKFDAGETFTDTSEPYIDANGNGVFDPGVEEFVDRDNDHTFDAPDGLYTGQSCVGDNTVCNRTTLYTWNAVPIIMSSSTAVISFFPATLSLNAKASSPITIVVLDTFGNQMAAGSEVKVSATEGSTDKSTFTVGNGTVIFNILYTAPDTAVADLLSVTVTSPESHTETVAVLPISVL